MNKRFASSESDSESITDRFVTRVRQGFKCTLCTNASGKPVVFGSRSRILAHTTTRIHIDRADHYDLGLRDRKPTHPADAGALKLETSQLETPPLPQSPNVDEAPISFPSSIHTPQYPSPPSSPTLPENDRFVPTYDYFQDSVYEDLVGEGDILSEGQPTSPQMSASCNDSSLPDFNHIRHPTREPLASETIWRPYTDEPHFLTYSLFHTAHVRFSQHQQEAILDWARAMGTPSVPTLSSLAKCGERVQDSINEDKSRVFQTDTGHIFHVNRLDAMLQQDMSNLNTRQNMRFYPRDDDGHVSEFWDGQKLSQGENRSQLTPMAVSGDKIYYVDEVCELDDESLFVPEMFLERQGDLWARGDCLASVHPVS